MKTIRSPAIHGLLASAYILVLFGPLLLFGSDRASAFSGTGSGTAGDPYIITTCDQLQEVSNNLAADYVLGGDIDCSDSVNWNGGIGFIPLGQSSIRFTGSLDGQGHTISDMTIDMSGNGLGYSQDAALFVATGDGTIQNLTISGGVAEGYDEAAALVADAYGTTIKNIHVDGAAMSTDEPNFSVLGGIAAFLYNDTAPATITQSWVTNTSISGASAIGGIVGYMDDGTQVSQSYVDDSDAISGNDAGGGIVGLMVGASSLNDDYAAPALSTFNGNAGGLAGQLGSGAPPVPSITDSYADADVSGNGDNVGGLVGLAQGSITNSFSAGLTSGPNPTTGGLAGVLDTAHGASSVNNAYDVSNTSQDNCVDGEASADCLSDVDILPVNLASSDPNYFFDNYSNRPLDKWDFLSTWAYTDSGYPVLGWQDIGHHSPPPANNSGSGGKSTPAAPSAPKKSLDQAISSLSSSAASLPSEITLDDYGDYTDGSGYQLSDLVVGQVLGFVVDNNGTTEHHTATVKAVSGDSATFTIASTPFDVTLTVGQSRTITLDGRNVMKISLNSITNGVASATFANIVPAASGAKTSAKPAAKSVAAPKSHVLLYVAVCALVAGAITSAVVWKHR